MLDTDADGADWYRRLATILMDDRLSSPPLEIQRRRVWLDRSARHRDPPGFSAPPIGRIDAPLRDRGNGGGAGSPDDRGNQLAALALGKASADSRRGGMGSTHRWRGSETASGTLRRRSQAARRPPCGPR